MTKAPATPLIEATANTKYISGSFNLPRFETAKVELDKALAEGKLWNVDWESWRRDIADACEHAQKISDDQFQNEYCDKRNSWPSGDPRYDVGYAFSMNQAAPLLRRLQKLPKDQIVPSLQHYMDILAEISSVWDYLKQFKPIIVKGRKPNPNAPPPDTTNMAECAICGKDFKLQIKGDKLVVVHHGYQISDGAGHYFGFRSGACPGFDYPPYELSCEANKEYKGHLEAQLKSTQERLADLQSGKVTELQRQRQVREGYGQYKTEWVKYTPESPEWSDVLLNEVHHTNMLIEQIDFQIQVQTERINKWKLQPIVFNGQQVGKTGFAAAFLNKKK